MYITFLHSPQVELINVKIISQQNFLKMKGNARHQVIERSVFFHNMVANMPSTAQL